MRFLSIPTFLSLFVLSVYADGSLSPPGLIPLINRANILFSSGQFSEAARVYSEAIEQSPVDYLLYYKRATAYFSLHRHGPALEDFDKVLSLTSGTFDNANLMKARTLTREGNFEQARAALKLYIKAKGSTSEAAELEKDIALGSQLEKKMERERAAELWNACVDTASNALRIAGYSIDLRSVRAECSLASGDVESAVGDLTRLSHLLPPSNTLLSTIFRLSYFILPPSTSPLSTLKRCLHYDPDSKPCLTLHRLFKSFDRAFSKLGELEPKEDWRGIVKLLTSSGSGKQSDILRKFDDALREHTARSKLLPPQLAQRRHTPEVPLPNALKTSDKRKTLMRALCKAHTQLGAKREMERVCEDLLGMDGCAEDTEGLIGRAEALLGKQEYQEALNVLERAWDISGRNRRDIQQRILRAQKLLKQSKQKDYYKILGVARDADQKTIKKAFRQAAKVAHPDKGGSEAKMATLNQAYEVLSKPELRQRFDNGEDPNDPQAGAGQGGQPFYHQQQGSAGGFGGFPGGHPFSQFFSQGSGGQEGGQWTFHFGR